MTPDPLSAASYASAGGVTFLGLTIESWGIAGVVVGIVITVLTYATTVWFRFRAEKKNK